MTLVDRIKKVAKEKYGWSLQTVSEKSGLGINTIYTWKTKVPTTEKLQKVADALDVSIDYLLGNTEDPNPKDTKYVDLSGTNIFTYQGLPIPEDDWDIIKQLLDRAANRGKNDDSGDK